MAIVSTNEIKGEVEVLDKRGTVTVKPTIVNEYNKVMNGCGRADQMGFYYNILNRKTVKWWKRVFSWCIEVSQVNAFILYCLKRYADEKPTHLLTFKEVLISEMLTEADNIKPENHKPHRVPHPNVPVTTQHKHLVTWSKDDRNCVICSGPGQRKSKIQMWDM